MQTVREIIEKSGGFSRLKETPIRIDNEPHMPIVIEYLGKTGFNKSDRFRVMQLEEKDGRILRDIEIYFECLPDGSRWRPVVWHSEIDGEKRFVYVPYEVNDGRFLTVINLDEMRLLQKRADVWDEDVFALGYLTATPETRQGNLFEAI
jgi:hypothetical protein